MRTAFVFFVFLLLVLAVCVGCASRGEKVMADCNTDAEKVRKCELFAKMYLENRVSQDWNGTSFCLDVCDKASLQVPQDPRPAYWHGMINLKDGYTSEACGAFKIAKDRGDSQAFQTYCNADGSPKN